MAQSKTENRKFVLAKRPKGEPGDDTLRLETEDVPTAGKGKLLLRNEYLSLDPYMRGRMSDAPSYAAPVAIGAVMIGGSVAQVVSSDVAGFAAGDWVQAFGGWQDYALSDGMGVVNMGPSPENPSWALGVLGMPGLGDLGLTDRHVTGGRSNNRAEVSHQPTRRREKQQRGFRSPVSAQRFLATHTAVYNHFNVQRHLIFHRSLRELRSQAFAGWREIAAA